MPIELRLLNARDVVGPEGNTLHTLVVQPKRFALVAFLVAARPWRTHPRDELLAMFWPDAPEENARNALSQALSFIRRTLGAGAVVSRGVDEVGIDCTVVRCDAVTFDESVRTGALADAMALYRRDLLEGFHVDEVPLFERWLEAERAYLKARAVACARSLSASSAAGGDWPTALNWSARAAELAPYDEAAVREVVLLHERLAQRSEALRVVEAFSARIASDLQVAPSPDLVQLAARIRSGGTSEPTTIAATPPLSTASVPPTRGPGTPRRTLRWVVAAGAVATIALSTQAMGRFWANDPPNQGARFALSLSDSVRIRSELSGITVALSRDGSSLAYVGGGGEARLHIRGLNDLEPRVLEGTEGAANPEWSADGKWLAFTQSRRLMRISRDGGPAVFVADSVDRFSWSDRNEIVLARAGLGGVPSGLRIVGAAGGEIETLTTPDTSHGETLHTWPRFLPGGRAIVFEIRSGDVNTSQLAVLRLKDRTITLLGVTGLNPRWLPTGRLAFAKLGGTVFTVPFSLRRLQVTGSPAPVLQHVVVKSGGAADFDVADNGTLVYVPEPVHRRLVLVARNGDARRLPLEPLEYSMPRLSPDAGKIAVVIGPSSHGSLTVYDVARGTRRDITSDNRTNGPSWSADGSRVIWHAMDGESNQMMWQRWDGSDRPTTIMRNVSAGQFTPSGTAIVATMERTSRSYLIPIDSSAKRVPVTSGVTRQIKLSPDGRWIAYTVGAAPRREVYVAPVPGPGGARQVSFGGGTEPVWNPRGGELFYRANGKLVAATVSSSADFTVVRRDTLFDDVYWSSTHSNNYVDYDVSPDGKYFVFVKVDGPPIQPIIALGWLSEMQERLKMSRNK